MYVHISISTSAYTPIKTHSIMNHIARTHNYCNLLTQTTILIEHSPEPAIQ